MSASKKWNTSKKTAKTDTILKQIASAWVASNKARCPDRLAVSAYRDRCKELGVYVPNDAYWSILMIVSAK